MAIYDAADDQSGSCRYAAKSIHRYAPLLNFPNSNQELGSQRGVVPPPSSQLQLHLKRSPYLLCHLPCRQSFLPLTVGDHSQPFSLDAGPVYDLITKKVFRVRSSRRRIESACSQYRLRAGGRFCERWVCASTGVMRVKRPSSNNLLRDCRSGQQRCSRQCWQDGCK